MLSVSAFPEPLRQGSADSDPEASKLRGLFGKKGDTKPPDSKPSTRPNTAEFMLPSHSPSSSRSSQAPTPSDEHDSYAQMVLSSEEPLPLVPQRPRKVSIPRRPPQVKKQTSLGRLEIGTGPRAVPGGPIANTLPKPPTPVLEPSMKNAEPTSPICRPLPLVPNPTQSPTVKVTRPPPPSKVLMSTPSRPRSHTTSPPTISVRYQPLFVDVDAKDARSPSPSTGSPSGQIRRLPNIPSSAATLCPPAVFPRHGPRPPRVKRPKSSTGICNGFTSGGRQSPFEVVPSSWASRPVDLNPIQPSSSRSPSSSRVLPPIQLAPRARSHSRPRPDPVEAAPSGSKTPISASPRHTRALSPISLTSSSAVHTSGRTSHNVTQSISPTSSPRLPSSLSPNGFLLAHADPGSPSTTAEEVAVAHPFGSTGAPLHYHPTERLSNDIPTHNPAPSLEVHIEAYIDDEDISSAMSRSPSPMQYARPNSRGSLSSLSDDSSDYSRSRSRAVRDQLRSYRRSYRGPKSPSRSPSPIQYARRNSLEALDELVTSVPPKRRPQPRSYQFDYKAAQDSSPFVRAASPERKSSDNSSKSNSSKSLSLKARRGRSKSSRHSRASRSRSPRWPRFGTPTGSVIDISVPSTLEPQRLARPSSEHRRASRSISQIDSQETLPDAAGGLRVLRSDSQRGASWKTIAGGSWEEVSKAGKKKQWLDLYNDDSAVVVTTIQPSNHAWKEEDMKRTLPKLRGVKVWS